MTWRSPGLMRRRRKSLAGPAPSTDLASLRGGEGKIFELRSSAALNLPYSELVFPPPVRAGGSCAPRESNG